MFPRNIWSQIMPKTLRTDGWLACVVFKEDIFGHNVVSYSASDLRVRVGRKSLGKSCKGRRSSTKRVTMFYSGKPRPRLLQGFVTALVSAEDGLLAFQSTFIITNVHVVK